MRKCGESHFRIIGHKSLRVNIIRNNFGIIGRELQLGIIKQHSLIQENRVKRERGNGNRLFVHFGWPRSVVFCATYMWCNYDVRPCGKVYAIYLLSSVCLSSLACLSVFGWLSFDLFLFSLLSLTQLGGAPGFA